ncbi:MAG: hypothetical protein HKN91_12770 [Acidimicrobiia bacterium]|nr:hypothetical protein [Acidimicrobiia bacterium]
MSRIRNTIDIAKSSWQVLKADKELMLLPIMSTIATLITIALFAIPIFMSNSDFANWEPTTANYIQFFIMYLALAYVTIFFNAALISAAHERLNGGDPTLGSAIRGATARAGKILPWALVAATVSFILRSLEERAGAIGRIVIGLVGMAWAVVTFLVLPIIVVEGHSVGPAVRRSVDLFKRTWGENLAAQVGFGLIGFFAAVPGIALIVLGAMNGLLVAVVVGIVLVAAVAIVMATLNGIFQVALYHFAADGTVPGGYFNDQAFAGAFRSKGGSRFL